MGTLTVNSRTASGRFTTLNVDLGSILMLPQSMFYNWSREHLVGGLINTKSLKFSTVGPLTSVRLYTHYTRELNSLSHQITAEKRKKKIFFEKNISKNCNLRTQCKHSALLRGETNRQGELNRHNTPILR